MAEAVAETTRATERSRKAARGRGRASDVFGGELRRRDVFPLLVLHLVGREPAYGNRLIEEIEEITQGVITVNPNTMYPLLRELERKGMIEGKWEHPDRRTRRFYSITDAGHSEYERLQGELSPFLDSMIRTLTLIKREIYGEGSGLRRHPRSARRRLGRVLRSAALGLVGRRLRDAGLRARLSGGRGGARLEVASAGRGQVRETVLAHEPRSLHRISYEDPESAGELETTFEMLPGADPRMTRVSQRLTYGLLGGGPLGAVTDFLFIRSQMRRSLERSLSDLRLEAGNGG